LFSFLWIKKIAFIAVGIYPQIKQHYHNIGGDNMFCVSATIKLPQLELA
jgi:hypothetical protein